jgi:hypothetical protein
MMGPAVHWRGFSYPAPPGRTKIERDREHRLLASPECLNIMSSVSYFLSAPHQMLFVMPTLPMQSPLSPTAPRTLSYQPGPPLLVRISTSDILDSSPALVRVCRVILTLSANCTSRIAALDPPHESVNPPDERVTTADLRSPVRPAQL